VGEIQEVTKVVVSSVENLVQSSEEILRFIDNQVVGDYKMLVQTGEQYNTDAHTVNNLVSDFTATASKLSVGMGSMVTAIKEITSANNEAAEGANNIAQKGSEMVKKATDVMELAQGSKESNDKLLEMVQRFKI